MPKIVDRDAYRLELLGKAFHIFADRGYSIPIRALAREMGVSTGTLYHYFPGKKELFEQMSVWIAHSAVDETLGDIPANLTLAQRLEIFNRMILSSTRDMTAIILLSIEYTRLTDGDQANNFFSSMFETFGRQLFEFLQLPEEVCYLMMAAGDGLLLYASVTNSTEELEGRLKLLSDMIVTYMDAQIKKE